MSVSQDSVRAELSRELQRLGTERGGQVVCLVVMLADEIEFIWPSELDGQQITDCECAIVEALLNGWADSAWHGSISR